MTASERLALGGAGALGVAALTISWLTWPHAFVDFGRELYVPWRLSEGDVLYRDIHYFNGPLSPHLNRLWFGLFGVSLRTLLLCNGLLVAGMAAMLYRILRQIGGGLGAACGCGLFLGVFAFCQLDPIGNDNYLTPYSHEMTHGLALGLVAVLGVLQLPDRTRAGTAIAGLALGVVFLTKAEIFLAAAAAVGTGLLVCGRSERWGIAGTARTGAICAAFALAPPLLAWALLTVDGLPAGEALLGTLGSWPHMLTSDVASQTFYRNTLGTVAPGANLLKMLGWASAWAAFAGVLLVAARLAGPGHEGRLRAPAFAFALASFGLGIASGASFVDVTRPLPLALTALLAADLLALSHLGPEASPRSSARLARAAFATFALVLLAKVALRARIDQYGFALAMPGAVLMVTLAVGALPAVARRHGGDPAMVRAGAVGGILAAIASLMAIASSWAALRTTPVGSGADRFLAGGYAPVVNALLAELGERSTPETTLAALPEGIMINYLARLENPTGHINFMPPELVMFGERSIVAAFEASPPDLIALIHKDTREYGVGFFGSRSYGEELFRWLEARYAPVAPFGRPPLRPGTRSGALLLERR